jgi:hypothetical protein
MDRTPPIGSGSSFMALITALDTLISAGCES